MQNMSNSTKKSDRWSFKASKWYYILGLIAFIAGGIKVTYHYLQPGIDKIWHRLTTDPKPIIMYADDSGQRYLFVPMGTSPEELDRYKKEYNATFCDVHSFLGRVKQPDGSIDTTAYAQIRLNTSEEPDYYIMAQLPCSRFPKKVDHAIDNTQDSADAR